MFAERRWENRNCLGVEQVKQQAAGFPGFQICRHLVRKRFGDLSAKKNTHNLRVII
jgi:hypothetical protein